MPSGTYWRLTFNDYDVHIDPKGSYCGIGEWHLMETPGGSRLLDTTNVVAKTSNLTGSPSLTGLNDNVETTGVDIPVADIPGGWIKYELDSSRDIKEFRLKDNTDLYSNSYRYVGHAPTSWVLEYSDNDVDWTTAHTATDITFYTRPGIDGHAMWYHGLLDVDNCWMLQCQSAPQSGNTTFRIAELELNRSGADLVEDAGTTLYATSTLSGSTPVSNIVEGTPSQYWESNGSSPSEAIYILTDKVDGVQITDYTITAADLATPDMPDEWTLKYSPDGVDWTIVDYRGDQTFTQAEEKAFTPGNVVWWRGHFSNSQSTLSYSDSNREISHDGGARIVIASAILTTGKWYWECTIQSSSVFATGDNVVVGMQHPYRTLTTSTSTPTDMYFAYDSNGSVYRDSVSQFASAPTFAGGTTTVLGFAYDADAGYLWIANSGVWLQGDPETGASPFDVDPDVVTAMCPSMGASTGATNADILIKDGSDAGFSYAVPDGFRPINQAATLNFQSDLISALALTEVIDAVKVGNRSITSSSATSDAYLRSFETIGAMDTSTGTASETMTGDGSILQSAITSAAQASGSVFTFLRELTATAASTAATSDAMTKTAELFASFSETLNAAMPILVGDDLYDIWVMEATNFAMSRYEGYNFNSFATFRGTAYAASSSGLVSLGGATDGGTDIDASMVTGRDDFSSEQLKRLIRGYLALTGDGSMELRVIRDDGSIDAYTLRGDGADEPTRRSIRMGKGARSHYWQFELRNVAGSDFTVSDLTLIPLLLRRRVQ